MDRQALIAQLLALPGSIHEAEGAVLAAEARLEQAKAYLTEREDQLLLQDGGPIDGRNSETRAAQLRAQTITLRGELRRVEETLRWAKRNLHLAQAQFAALRATARLLTTSEPD